MKAAALILAPLAPLLFVILSGGPERVFDYSSPSLWRLYGLQAVSLASSGAIIWAFTA